MPLSIGIAVEGRTTEEIAKDLYEQLEATYTSDRRGNSFYEKGFRQRHLRPGVNWVLSHGEAMLEIMEMMHRDSHGCGSALRKYYQAVYPYSTG